MANALETAIKEFFDGITIDNKGELLPISKTLGEFGSQGTTRYAGDRSSLEWWLVKRLVETNPGYVIKEN